MALHLDAEVVVCSAASTGRCLPPSTASLPAAQATFSSSFSSSSVSFQRPPTPPIPEEDCQQYPSAPSSGAAPTPVEDGHTLQTIRRWGKAAREALALTVRVSSSDPNAKCTSFDPVRHVVPMQSAACNDDDSFLQYALDQAVYLGSSKEGRILQFPLAGFPTPQVCIHPIICSSYVTLPIGLAAGVACTVTIERSATAFDLMLLLEKVCGVEKLHRHLVAKQLSHVFVNGEVVPDPFTPGTFQFADSASILGAYVLTAHSTVQEVTPVDIHPSRRDGFFTIHRPSHPPVHLHVSPLVGPLDLPGLLRRAGLLGSRGTLRRPDFSPCDCGGSAHFLALDLDDITHIGRWAIVDLQRIVHPPFVRYWTTDRIHSQSSELLAEILHQEFPSAGPILTAFVDIFRIDQIAVDYPNPLITVVGLPRTPEAEVPVLEPALLETREVLLMRPGFAAQSLRFQQGRSSTTASTTFMQGSSSTTTTSLVVACPHPCSPLEAGDVSFHMAVPTGEFASTSVANHGSICDVLFALCRALRGQGRLPPGTPYRSTDNAVVGCRTVQVFIHPDRGSTPPRCWVWYPEWRSEPAFLSCSSGFSRSALLQKLGITDRGDVRIALQGAADPSFFEPGHGDVIVIHRRGTVFIQVPLVNLWPRFQDVIALLFPIHAPSAAVLVDDHRLQHYWRSCIGRFQALLGLNRPGARVVIAGITQPSLVLCTGSALPPLQAEVQRYYNDFLASHFGWIRIVDTGQLCGDACLMAERWLHPFDRHWVIQTPHGIIPVAGDAVGLSEAPFGSGWYVHPTLIVADVGIACKSRRNTYVELEFPPGSSLCDSNSSMEGFCFQVAHFTAAESADARSRMAVELHSIERDGIPAPGTPDQAFPSGKASASSATRPWS